MTTVNTLCNWTEIDGDRVPLIEPPLQAGESWNLIEDLGDSCLVEITRNDST